MSQLSQLPQVPAFCNKCNEFFPSGIAGYNFTICSIGVTCPKCHNMGYIPDGTYNVFEETVEFLSGSSVKQLKELEGILKTAKVKKYSYEELTKAIDEKLPSFSSLTEYINQNRINILYFIFYLSLLLNCIIQFKLTGNYKFSDLLPIAAGHAVNMVKAADSTNSSKSGVNSPCPCGSGLKFKKCCGK